MNDVIPINIKIPFEKRVELAIVPIKHIYSATAVEISPNRAILMVKVYWYARYMKNKIKKQIEKVLIEEIWDAIRIDIDVR